VSQWRGGWRFYNDLARIERSIKELKQDYALGDIPMRRFDAKPLYVEVLRLAYNLVVGFQTSCLPPRWAAPALTGLLASSRVGLRFAVFTWRPLSAPRSLSVLKLTPHAQPSAFSCCKRR
jgi:hypothetical protein